MFIGLTSFGELQAIVLPFPHTRKCQSTSNSCKRTETVGAAELKNRLSNSIIADWVVPLPLSNSKQLAERASLSTFPVASVEMLHILRPRNSALMRCVRPAEHTVSEYVEQTIAAVPPPNVIRLEPPITYIEPGVTAKQELRGFPLLTASSLSRKAEVIRRKGCYLHRRSTGFNAVAHGEASHFDVTSMTRRSDPVVERDLFDLAMAKLDAAHVDGRLPHWRLLKKHSSKAR